MLGRTLVERNSTRDELYAETVGQILVMHVARMELSQPTASPLPKWRLKRVQAYIDAHLDEALSLPDLAAVAGLSPMYFAGQFRAATGYRPHDYLLNQRIESAKSILSGTDTPLAAVALSVGFRAQAHFSTVFKRLTGQSPGRWRRAIMSERQFPDASLYPEKTWKALSRMRWRSGFVRMCGQLLRSEFSIGTYFNLEGRICPVRLYHRLRSRLRSRRSAWPRTAGIPAIRLR